MNTTARFFHDRMHNICVALNKEKGLAAFRHTVTMGDDQDDDFITPYTLQEFLPKCNHHSRSNPVFACVPICEPSPKKSEKYQPHGIWGLNRQFERGVKKAVGFILSFFCCGMKPPSMLQAHLW